MGVGTAGEGSVPGVGTSGPAGAPSGMGSFGAGASMGMGALPGITVSGSRSEGIVSAVLWELTGHPDLAR